MDRETRLKEQRLRRKANGNLYTKKYEKTINGFLVRLYRNMKSRVTGVQYKKAHLYLGKELLPKDDFYKWAKRSKKFKKMFLLWEESKYDRKLCPTVDRIDNSIGYILSNMRWLTMSENSSRSNGGTNKNY